MKPNVIKQQLLILKVVSSFGIKCKTFCTHYTIIISTKRLHNMNSYSLIVHLEISQGSSAILKIYFIKSNLCNLHAFYSLIDVTEQADGNLILEEELKFLPNSSIYLVTFGLIAF